MKHISASSFAFPPSTPPINGDSKAQASSAHNPSNLSPRQLRLNAALVDRTNNQTAAQTAKREIRSKLRDDWTWPPTSPAQLTLNLPESESQWRERESDSSYSPPPDPYQYDSPDAVITPILSKKRKRQQQLQEELRWNEGLRCYIERRDAWSGARLHKPQSTQFEPTTADIPDGTSPPPRPPPPPPRTPPPDQTTQLPSPTPPKPYSHTPPPPLQSSLPPLMPPTPHPTTPQPRPPTPLTTTLIPLAPPLLPPTNPIRASITPATHPSIYSKVVLQGQTPTIPINLQDVVSALVQGWKKDGEWPPKSDGLGTGTGTGVRGNGNGIAAEAGGGSGRGRGREMAKRGVGRFKRVLRLGLLPGHEGGGEGDGEGEGERG